MTIGDVESLHAVIAEHRPFVRNALARMGVVGSALEDAEQEVFLVLVRRRSDYDPAYSVRQWLWGISRNVAAAQRRRARRGVGPLHDDAVVEPPRAEDRVAVVQALAQLDDDHRSIWLARQRGCTAAEIATDRRVPLTTVQWRLREAQRRLKAAVGRAGQRCRAFVIWLPRAVNSAMSTGATTVAAGAALAACLAATPEDNRSEARPVSQVIEAATPEPELRHVRAGVQPVPPVGKHERSEADGIVIFEEPTVEPAPEEAVQTAPATRRAKRTTHRRRRRAPVPHGRVELLEPRVAPG